jgi:type IV pilus assembly protein PilE
MNRAKRAEAKSALLEGAQALERYYSLQGSYLDADGDLAAVFATQAPTSGAANYTIAAQGNPTATSYVLQATRTNRMAGDACGDFRIAHTGAQTLDDAERAADECW